MTLVAEILASYLAGAGTVTGIGFIGARYIKKHPEIIMKQITRRMMQAVKEKPKDSASL